MRPARCVALALLALAPAAAASAADVSAFLAVAKPGENWAGGAGAAFGIGFFQVLRFEAEYAHMPGEFQDERQDSLVGSAMVAPSFGRLQPYVGLGIGGYWQDDNGRDDTGVEHNFIAGLRLKLGLVFLKGEYRKISLPDDALIEMNDRFSVGAGIQF
jgi:hypothetical protein